MSDSVPSLSADFLPGLTELGQELLVVEELKSRGHTGAKIEQDSGRLQVVYECLALGIGKERIAKLVGTSTTVIVELARRHGADVVREKKELSALCREGATRLVRRIVDEADDLPIQSAALSAGILLDKSLLLDGEATSRVEHMHVGLDHGSYLRAVEALPAERVESGENSEQKAMPACLPIPASESQSLGSTYEHGLVVSGSVSGCAVPNSTQAPPTPGGGGGLDTPGAAETTRV